MKTLKRSKYIVFAVTLVISLIVVLSIITRAFASAPDTKTIDSGVELSQGTLTNTSVINTGLATVELAGQEYSKQLTFNNTGGALTDYQVLIDEGEVKYWKMDEASGTSVADSSGTGLSDTATGTTITTGKWGNSRQFSGSSQFINVTNPNLRYNYNQSFTISTWVYKQANSVSYAAIIAQQASTSGYFTYALQEDGNQNICAVVGRYAVASYTTCHAIPLTTWTHIVMTYSANTVTLYYNGEFSGTAAYPGTVVNPPNGTAYLGNDPASPSNRWWNGRIDEVRVYNRAFSAAEVNSLYTNNRSPLLDSVYGHVQEAGNDIRFRDSDNTTNLNYWVERFTASGQNAKIWVKVPSIGASSTKNIFMYYGSGGAAGSNGANTFDFFDDFNDGDYSGWTVRAATNASWAVINGELVSNATCGGTCTNDYGLLGSSHTITNGIIEASVKLADVSGLTNIITELVGRGADSWTTGYSNTLYKYPSTTKTSKLQVTHSSTIVEQSFAFNYNQWYRLKLSLNGTAIVSCVEDKFCVSGTNASYASGSVSLANYQARNGSTYDNVRVRKFAASEPAIQTVGAEQLLAYQTSGSWESATNSNVVDLVWNGGWGDGVNDSSTVFSAVVSNVNATDTITFKMRVSQTPGGLSSAAYQTLGVANTGTTFTKTKADFDALPTPLPIGNYRYVQILAEFVQTSGTSPALDSMTINYMADDTNPSATTAAGYFSEGGRALDSGDWANSIPYFEFSAEDETAGGEPESGIRGYCLYFGDDPLADPMTTKGFLTNSEQPGDSSGCQYVTYNSYIDLIDHISILIDQQTGEFIFPFDVGDVNYLNARAIDLLGHTYSTGLIPNYNVYSFRFDNILPTNPQAISAPQSYQNDVSQVIMYWPTSGTTGSQDANSGVKGFQYRIGSTGDWYGSNHVGDGNCDDVITTGQYQLNATYDEVEVGENVFQLRTLDNACNVTSAYVTAIIKYSGVAPSEPQNLTVTPTTNTENAFGFDWVSPALFNGQESGLSYCYSVNTKPSLNVCSWTSSSALTADAYATQPGLNTMYVVARDEAGNVNYDAYASVNFEANTSAPSAAQSVDISDISIKTTSNWKLAVTWSVPLYTGTGITSYKVYRTATANVDCVSSPASFSLIGSTAGTSYSDTGLSQLTYSYCVKACDSTSNCSAYSSTVSMMPTGRFITAATLISGPSVTRTGTQSAAIEWVTDRTSDSRIVYGLSSGSYFTEEIANSQQVTSHDITLSNLRAGTTYYYLARWTDEDGNTGQSPEGSFTTKAAPQVIDAKASEIGLHSATVSFNVSGASEVTLLYGKSGSYTAQESINTSATLSKYSIRLLGLNDGTQYSYKFALEDVDGNSFPTLVDFVFTTPPSPKVSNVRIQQVKNSATPTIQVTWDTNTETTSILSYYQLVKMMAQRMLST